MSKSNVVNLIIETLGEDGEVVFATCNPGVIISEKDEKVIYATASKGEGTFYRVLKQDTEDHTKEWRMVEPRPMLHIEDANPRLETLTTVPEHILEALASVFSNRRS